MGPSVSFLIAAYNRADYLDKCIESIFRQTLKDFEVIVVDDCSTDGTEALIREKYANRVIYHRHYINRGVAFARNVALDYASGAYLGFIDSDDILYSPRYLETALGLLKSDANIHIFCCDTFCIDAMGNKISEQTLLQSAKDYKGVKLHSKIMGFDDMFFYGIHSGGVLVKKEVIKEIGFLNTSYRIVWDEDFFLRLTAYKPEAIYYYNEPLIGYRLHPGNISNNVSGLYLERIRCRQDILRKNAALRKRLGYRVNKRLAELHIYLIDAYLKEGNIAGLIVSALRSILLYPLILGMLFRHGLNFSKRTIDSKVLK